MPKKRSEPPEPKFKARVLKRSQVNLMDDNPNKGTKRGRKLVKRSLEKYRFGRPVLADRNLSVIAGNKTHEAAGENSQDDDVLVIETDGGMEIIHQRTDLDLTDPDDFRAAELSVVDNQTAHEGLDWDNSVIKQFRAAGMEFDEFFTAAQIKGFELDPDEKAELLALMNVTTPDPETKVERGDVWDLGPHVLACFDVVTDWAKWFQLLESGSLLAVYPGPYVPLSTKADEFKIVMIQPSRYIAGHIIDRYLEIHGSDSGKKR